MSEATPTDAPVPQMSSANSAPSVQQKAIPAPQEGGARLAGIGGVGSGCLLVWLAQHVVGIETFTGQLLLYAAPFCSVAAGTIVLFLLSQMGLMALIRAARKAKKALQAQLDDPRVSKQTKAKIQADMDEIDSHLSAIHLRRVQAFSAFANRWLTKLKDPA